MNNFNLRKGFTLVELLIVIIIVAVLAAVILVAINPAEQRAKALMSTGRSNTAAVCRAQALCLVENDLDDCLNFVGAEPNPGMIDTTNPSDSVWTYAYLSSATEDPNGTLTATSTPIGGTTFLLTCQNIDSETRSQVWCDTDGEPSTYDCEDLGFDPQLVVQ